MFVVPFFFKLTTTEGANTPLLLIEKITRNWSNCIIVLFKFSNTKAEPLPMVGSFPIGSWLVFFPFILQFPLLLCDCKCNQPARIWRKKKKGNEHFFCWVASSSVPSAFPVPFTIHHSLSQGIEWQKKTIRCNRSKYKQKERKEKKKAEKKNKEEKHTRGQDVFTHTHTGGCCDWISKGSYHQQEPTDESSWWWSGSSCGNGMSSSSSVAIRLTTATEITGPSSWLHPPVSPGIAPREKWASQSTVSGAQENKTK